MFKSNISGEEMWSHCRSRQQCRLFLSLLFVTAVLEQTNFIMAGVAALFCCCFWKTFFFPHWHQTQTVGTTHDNSSGNNQTETVVFLLPSLYFLPVVLSPGPDFNRPGWRTDKAAAAHLPVCHLISRSWVEGEAKRRLDWHSFFANEQNQHTGF